MVTGEKTISYLLDNLLCFSNVRSVKYEVGTMFFWIRAPFIWLLPIFRIFQFLSLSFSKMLEKVSVLYVLYKNYCFFLFCRNEEKSTVSANKIATVPDV